MSRVRSVIDGTLTPVIVIDTREQLPFAFTGFACDDADGGGPLAVVTRRGTLASGDYSILGHETQVAVERKSLADLYGTIGQGRDRFERELGRLNAMAWAAVVVEASLDDVIRSPPPHSGLPPKTVFRSVVAWQQRFPRVHWTFAGPRPLAEAYTLRALERFWKERQGEKKEQLVLIPGNSTFGMPD